MSSKEKYQLWNGMNKNFDHIKAGPITFGLPLDSVAGVICNRSEHKFFKFKLTFELQGSSNTHCEAFIKLSWLRLTLYITHQNFEIDFLLSYNVGRPIILKVLLSWVHCRCIWEDLAPGKWSNCTNWIMRKNQLVQIRPLCRRQILPNTAAMNSARWNL